MSEIHPLSPRPGYALQAYAASTSPTDGAVTYFGSRPGSALGSINVNKIYIPKAGTVRSIQLFFANTGVLGSNETSTAAFFLNGTTATTISAAVTNDSAQTTFSNPAMGVAVALGDYFEIRMTWASWGTNPTNVFSSASVYIET